MATTTESAMGAMALEPQLLGAVIGAVQSGLQMCNVPARCVGFSTVPNGQGGSITGMIGLHGKATGFVAVNMPERFAMAAVSGLLDEQCSQLSSQVVDGVGEITNIVVGGIKKALATTPHAVSHITVPSVIVGNGYQIAFAKGLDFVCAIFEHQDPEALRLDDRLMYVSMSLLKL